MLDEESESLWESESLSKLLLLRELDEELLLSELDEELDEDELLEDEELLLDELDSESLSDSDDESLEESSLLDSDPLDELVEESLELSDDDEEELLFSCSFRLLNKRDLSLLSLNSSPGITSKLNCWGLWCFIFWETDSLCK